MVISGFDWDDDNILHIAEHRILRKRWRKSLPVATRLGEARQKLYIALGETFDGRLAFVVFRRLTEGFVRVITARDMDDTERRLFRRK